MHFSIHQPRYLSTFLLAFLFYKIKEHGIYRSKNYHAEYHSSRDTRCHKQRRFSVIKRKSVVFVDHIFLFFY